ncbi:protoporphyrinogen oxidase [Brachybacterium huguangmaarense]|uniref:Coproporphyrinogen III oxidase n=1 Tax=Brachybacterium huguangmaarense TaxID=1652028 RepID=A0ABY6G3Y4_9MICO|nr:protoporphyrinogen oxidase [Brachybacterium huguangmaarense]UYG17920.1 protoporphyrinogen oxidase [Brachybacterium huguangmaarense]
MTARTLVVGGGIAGLLAARRRAARGDTVTVLEASDQVGGAVRAVEVGGLEVNAGAEAFSVTSGAVEDLLGELGLAAQIAAPAAGRGSRLVSDAGSLPSPRGGLLGIPGRPLSREARAVLGTAGALRAAADRALPSRWGLADGVTIGAYVRRRMGRRVAERLVAPVVGGVHSSDPETLELAAIQPRLPAAVREHGSLAGAVRALRPRRSSAGTAVRSVTPTMAELPRALRRELEAAGAVVRTGVRVTGLERDGSTWRARLETAGSTPGAAPELLEADCLVLAVPPDAARALLTDAAPDLARAIPEAPSSPVRLVVLVLDAPALDAAPSGTGALVAPGTRGVRAKALTHASAKWDHVREAAHGLHVVRLSYGRPGEALPADDSALEADGGASTIVDRALADASAILTRDLDRTQLRGAAVVTWPDAMRQALPGHREALDRLAELLAEGDDTLELVGSWRDGTGLDAMAAAERRRRRPDPGSSGPTDPSTTASPASEGRPR